MNSSQTASENMDIVSGSFIGLLRALESASLTAKRRLAEKYDEIDRGRSRRARDGCRASSPPRGSPRRRADSRCRDAPPRLACAILRGAILHRLGADEVALEAVCAEYGVAESLVLEAATSAASPPVTGEAAERRLRFLRRIGVEDVGDAARRHPALLVYDVRTQVAPRVEYLLSLGVTEPGALVARAPALLGRDDLHTKVAILQALGVTRIAWWLQTNPGVLEVDIDAQIKPAVDALREVPRLDVARVLSRQPQVLARGYGDGVKLRERLAWLRDELGLTQPGRAVSLHPNLLTYSVEHNLLPRVEWLRSSGFPDPALVIARNPAIASRSIERALEPIFQYVTGPMGRSVDEVANFAHVFSYSLDFIRRRHMYLESDGRNLGSKYTLKRILECSDYHFATRYAKHPDLRDGKTVSYDRKDEMLDEYDAWHPANEPAAADGGGGGGDGEGEGGDGGEGEGGAVARARARRRWRGGRSRCGCRSART